ncbi:MAG: YbaK/EbsC family protein [Bacteroidales bacterium]|jgi:prolyl-tRNA editing enzyme YbaK/EbsC (Cys-tRNA(Pro) deacylase)|nr:YbaK/EbsC family protein [Bacteroidales bacterium]
MKTFSLGRPVVSCKEAADAKGIPLSNELKTLILDTSDGLYALHIRGDKKANLRSIKKILNTDEACLASEETLEELRVVAGTVTPYLRQIWNLPQLLSCEVLLCEFVSTNAGVRDKYIIFDPSLLTAHSNTRIGCFYD